MVGVKLPFYFIIFVLFQLLKMIIHYYFYG